MTTFEATLPGGSEVQVGDHDSVTSHSIPGLTVFGIPQGLIELGTLAQAARTAALPFVGPFMALMPDAHVGKGATIGSVIPTRDVVIPAAVGVDIGCGVYAARLDVGAEEVKDRAADLLVAMRSAVPLGSGRAWELGKMPGPVELWASNSPDAPLALHGTLGAWERQVTQIGTLGGGNHFIELAATDQGDQVWLLIHSGSRGTGARIAEHYMAMAQAQCRQWFIDLPDKDLAYLPTNSEQGQRYLHDMQWAVDYAAINRGVMASLVLDKVREVLGRDLQVLDDLDTPHNYARKEQIGKHPALVIRKGAISARAGERGIIPGSMGTASYLVTGRGNQKGLQSAPHGAGRPRSRTASRKMIDMAELEATTHHVAMLRTDDIRDEAPGAYKDVEAVMDAARELVVVDYRLLPLINVKGGK